MIAGIRFLPRRWWSVSAWKTWKDYIHWRLETYGVYYPAGQMNRKALISLLKQLPSYLKWVRALDRLRAPRYGFLKPTRELAKDRAAIAAPGSVRPPRAPSSLPQSPH